MRILIFGDSIAQGYYDLKMGGWVNLLYLDILKRKVRATDYTTEIFNVSVSGDTIPRITSRLENEIDSRRWENEPIVLIFAMGINDARLNNGSPASTVEQFRNDLEGLFSVGSRHSDHIFFLGLTDVYEPESNPWVFNTGKDDLVWTNNRIAEFDKALSVFAKDKGATFISVFDTFTRRGQNGEELHADGLHPNAAGHRLIYEQVRAAMTDLLNTSAS